MISSSIKYVLRRVPNDVKIRSVTRSSVVRSDDDSNKKNNAKNQLNELLLSILKENPDNEIQSKPTKFKKPKKLDIKQLDLGQKLTEAAKNVAIKVEGDPDKNEAELLHRLLYKNETLQKSVLKASGNKTLSDLLSGMSVEQEKQKKMLPESKFGRADQVRNVFKGRTRMSQTPRNYSQKRIDIFGEEPLNWFNVSENNPKVPVLSTWEHCHNRELRISVTHPPSNYWEQLIIWTDRGILWKFPIDNEQGLDDEKLVSFEDHVFLETYLEGWCPNKGPVRHFMELVCVGLSRNHWLSADEKKAHMMWYKDYFLDKKNLLLEIGAGEVTGEVTQEVAK